ncbi:hypothetical protein MKW92_050124 [Papaver armeniacum]|nr:hypothetical protein MKW92_050124 [Papaver armeniacum]
MAPRKKLTRYDAAYDHLGPLGLGFPKRVIRSKIDSLLKVYGKDEGWIFIEECSYKLLIECLCEDQEILLLKGPEDEEDRGNLLLKEKEEEDEDQQLLENNSSIFEKRITRSSSGARTSKAITVFEPIGYESRTEEAKKRIEENKYLLPAAQKKRSLRELTALVVFGNDDDKLVSAQEKSQERLTGPVQGSPQYLLPAAEKERSQRKPAGLLTYGNDYGKLDSAEEKSQERLTGPVQGSPQCLLPAAEKERSQRKPAGLLTYGNYDGKLVSAQEKSQERLTWPVQGSPQYLLPAAEKERSQRLLTYGNDDGKLVSAQEKSQERLTGPLQGSPQYCMRRPCFGLLDNEDDGEDDYVFSETKASVREQMIREGSVIPREVQKSWWDAVGAT